VLPRHVKTRNSEVRKREMTLKLQLDAFATPGFHLVCRLLSPTWESGMITSSCKAGTLAPAVASDSSKLFQKFLKG
jgi:hypothetical protein